MRLLHIADLHAGKTLGKVSRNPDLQYSLEQVVSFVKENKIDLVLIAGDVFDKANPDNESKELIFNFFLSLKDLASEVVVISGNHDSYDFMKSISGLSRLANVHIYDRPSKERYLFQMKDLKVACLPYPSERVITSADEDSKKSYAQIVGKFIKFLAHSVKDAKHKVLLAHLFVAGSKYTRTEKEATITQHYAVNPADLTEVFDYVALGHVHRHQRIEQAPTQAYYTGTLYQLDFSEAGDDKFFNLITFEEGPPKIEPVKLSLKNPLKVFDLKQSEVLRELPRMEAEPGYIKVVIRIEDRTTVPITLEKLRTALGEKLLRIEQITPDTPTSEGYEVKSMSPLELYREYYQLSYSKELPKEIEERFLELLKRAEES